MIQDKIQENKVSHHNKGSKWESAGSYNNTDSYQYFLDNITPETKHTIDRNIKNFNSKKYLEICSDFNKALVESLLRGNIHSLYGSLGTLEIQCKKITNIRKRVDWGATLALKEKLDAPIYHTNDHTNHTYYKFKWTRGNCHNVTNFKFVTVKSAKQRLCKRIREKGCL